MSERVTPEDVKAARDWLYERGVGLIDPAGTAASLAAAFAAHREAAQEAANDAAFTIEQEADAHHAKTVAMLDSLRAKLTSVTERAAALEMEVQWATGECARLRHERNDARERAAAFEREARAWRASRERCECVPDPLTSGRWCASCYAGLTAIALKDANQAAYPEEPGA